MRIAERTKPWLPEGAAKSRRDVEDVDIAVEVICSVNDDREVAYRGARIHVGFYVSQPVRDPVIAPHGLGAERDAVRQGLISRGLDPLAVEISTAAA